MNAKNNGVFISMVNVYIITYQLYGQCLYTITYQLVWSMVIYHYISIGVVNGYIPLHINWYGQCPHTVELLACISLSMFNLDSLKMNKILL